MLKECVQNNNLSLSIPFLNHLLLVSFQVWTFICKFLIWNTQSKIWRHIPLWFELRTLVITWPVETIISGPVAAITISKPTACFISVLVISFASPVVACIMSIITSKWPPRPFLITWIGQSTCWNQRKENMYATSERYHNMELLYKLY